MSGTAIVVGVDLSPESLRAVELAAKLAPAAGGPLVPVHAVPVVPAVGGMGGMAPISVYSPELQVELNRAAREQVRRGLEKIIPPDAVRRLEVQTGPAPFVLADVAANQRADLVVLGGKAHGALARGLGRSTAHYLVRKLDASVLVVGGSAAPFARVLAAVDLSPTSLPTVRAAQWFAKLFAARLRLVHVVEPFRYTQLSPDQWDEDAYYRNSDAAFARFASQFEQIPKNDRLALRGLAAETIAEEARAWHADLIVVGSHGKGWVDRILIGSTAERLVTELPTSILVVPVSAAQWLPIAAKRSPAPQKRPARGAASRRIRSKGNGSVS